MTRALGKKVRESRWLNKGEGQARTYIVERLKDHNIKERKEALEGHPG